MSSDTIPVSVRILDKDYKIACPAHKKTDLIESARYLDKQMREVRETQNFMGLERIAVLAALNIAYELLQAKANGGWADEVGISRINKLVDRIDAALHQNEQLDL